MNQRLLDLYSHVSVHATADLEHEAAVELLLLVMTSDHHISEAEIDEIRHISEDSGWETDTFSFDQYLGSGDGQGAPGAVHARPSTRCSTTSTPASSNHLLRAALFSAARDVAGVDHDDRPRGAGPPRPDRRPLRLTRRPISEPRCPIATRCRWRVGRRASAMRSWPARSGRTSTSTRPAARSSSATAGPWPVPISSTSHPPGCSQSRRARGEHAHGVEAVGARVQRAARLPVVHRAFDRRVALGDVRRVRHDGRERAVQVGGQRVEPRAVREAGTGHPPRRARRCSPGRRRARRPTRR